MVGRGLALFALFSFAGCGWTNKSIFGIVCSMNRFDIFTVNIFFGGISGITLLKFELSFTLEAFDEVAHFPDGFVLQDFETLVAEHPFDLVFHHVIAASYFEAPEVASLVDKF